MPKRLPLKPGDPLIRPIDYTIDDNGCWVWNWAVSRKGYASMRVDGQTYKVHRLAYKQAYGEIPEGQQIRHMCGNPSCVNAKHLQTGTQTDNSRDMVEAGNQHHQKFTWDVVRAIRQEFAQGGVSRAEIARRRGVSNTNINLIIANKTFHDDAYTPPPPPKRRPKGSLRSKVDFDMAKEIRRLYAAGGISQLALAERFHLNEVIISDVVSNKLYPDPNYERPVRRNHNQKLTKEDADAIREKLDEGATPEQLAEEYVVSVGLINQINVGKIHKDTTREYRRKNQGKSEPRPLLRSINGPAPTSLVAQQRRLAERQDQQVRPPRKPGEPLITEDDWELDPETGCHKWRWGTTGRGSVTDENGKRRLPYHVVWEMHNRRIKKGEQINHLCNNGRCIRVEHLYLGDQFDNMRDVAKGGYHANRKLNWEQARAVRSWYEPGKTTYEKVAMKLADECGVTVSEASIENIISNKTFYDENYTSKNPQANVNRVLSNGDAYVIRKRYKAERVTLSALGREYGVHQSVIGGIIHNRTYKDPNYTPPSPEEFRQWKLSPDDVSAIQAEYIENPRKGIVKSLAKKYGVCSNTILRVLKGGR